MSLLSALLTILPYLQQAPHQDWSHWRGPNLSGAVEVESGPPAQPGFAVRWKSALGPAYSGVVVEADCVVTMYSDAVNDYLVALNRSDGSRLWQVRVNPVYRGHDGSEDGPVSTPAIGGGTVVAVGAVGHLLAVDAVSGVVRWRRQLVEDLHSEAPEYGYACAPLIHRSQVFVQVGGKDQHSICAFDLNSGSLRWSYGDSKLVYQSPVLLSLCQRDMLVVPMGPQIVALDPDSGTLLWQHDLGEAGVADTGIATPIDERRFAINVSSALTAFEVKPEGDGYAVKTLYRSRDLGGSYAAPVVYDGHFYGFRSDFLSCLEADTGKRVWKSRPPGGRGLIRVGSQLLIMGAQGTVVLAQATPEGYRELARHKALEHSGYAYPAYSGGDLFVRNSDQLVCLEIESDASPSLALTDAPLDPSSRFGRFLHNLEGHPDKAAAVAGFLDQQESFPLVDGNLVHFLYRGEGEDVVVSGSMTDARLPDPLLRVPGTQLFYRSYEMDPEVRWEYRFQVDFGDWIEDPRNPGAIPARWGSPLSEVRGSKYRLPAGYPQTDPPSRGRLEKYTYLSAALGNEREIQVYLPAGYDDSTAAYPLLLVHEGTDWLQKGRLVATLDQVVGQQVAPLVVVFVAAQRHWWFEGGGSRTEPYLDALATEFLADLNERYRLQEDPRARCLYGRDAFGLTAVYGALRHPEVFGRAATQSPHLQDVTHHALFDRLEQGPKTSAEFYVQWNRFEKYSKDGGYDLGKDGQRLWLALQSAGYQPRGGEVADGYGWGSWRAHMATLLLEMFPAEEASAGTR